MQNLVKIIQKSGLNEKQAKVYVATLELGEATITQIARKSLQKRPTVYLIMEELEIIGLISSVSRGKRVFYSAAHPKRLRDMIVHRQQEIESILPELIARYNVPIEKPKIQAFEGVQGIEMVYKEMYAALDNKEEGLFFGNISFLQERFPEVLDGYLKCVRSLKNPKIRELVYYDQGGFKWAQKMTSIMKRNKSYQIKLLSGDLELGATDNLIFGSKLIIFSLSSDAFALVVESKEIVRTYRTMFECAWKCGKTTAEVMKVKFPI